MYEFDTPEYNALIPLNQRQPGSRSAIVVDIHKVGSVRATNTLICFVRADVICISLADIPFLSTNSKLTA